jgi:hypothetical protein
VICTYTSGVDGSVSLRDTAHSLEEAHTFAVRAAMYLQLKIKTLINDLLARKWKFGAFEKQFKMSEELHSAS